jgi:hypothetical protein
VEVHIPQILFYKINSLINKKYLFKHFGSIMTISAFVFFAVASGDPPSPTTKKISLSLTSGYLGNCSAYYSGVVRPVNVTLSVNIYDGNGGFKSNEVQRINGTNSDRSDSNLKFNDVEVPTKGSIIVTVSAEATECYNCCMSQTCTIQNNYKPAGKPYYWVTSGNKTTEGLSSLEVTPVYNTCF